MADIYTYDPEVERLCNSCTDHMFKAANDWCDANEANAFYLTHAMACLWFTFCGQLPKERQQQLLDHFGKIAFADLEGLESPQVH